MLLFVYQTAFFIICFPMFIRQDIDKHINIKQSTNYWISDGSFEV